MFELRLVETDCVSNKELPLSSTAFCFSVDLDCRDSDRSRASLSFSTSLTLSYRSRFSCCTVGLLGAMTVKLCGFLCILNHTP